MKKRFNLWVCLPIILIFPFCAKGEDPYQFADNALTIRTDRYEVIWKDGSITSAKTFLPVERTLTSSSPRQEPGLLPNGPGYREDGGEKPLEFHPWLERDINQVQFSVNHSPSPAKEVKFERTEEGATLQYSIPNSDLLWIQHFKIDSETGDLLISQKAKSSRAGLSGISFGIYNLNANIPLAVPVFPGNGQTWRGDYAKDSFINLSYPVFWPAGIIVGMIPEGGSFAVWSEDNQFLPKYFRHYTDGTTRAIGFDASLNYPYDKNKEIEVFTWRFNTFPGNWTQPATRYRDHLQQAYSIKPLSERFPKWLDSLSMIWSTGGGTDEELATMARKIDPDKVILWHFSGSTADPGINQKVPSYVPEKGFVDRNLRARAVGFHIAAYYSMALVDVHEHPDMMKEYGLGFYFDALSGSEIKEATKRLIYVHPGSQKWRDFYVKKMEEVYNQYGVDVLYQDVSGTGPGSAGVIEGLNFHQAVVAADKAIHDRLPEAALGGEYRNEVTIVHESVGLQRSLGWGTSRQIERMSRMDQPHPILSLLFSPFSYYYGYKVPFGDNERWHRDQNMNEVIGSLPDWRGSVDDEGPEAKINLLRAGLFADGFKPWFPEDWKPGVVAYMRNSKGEIIEYRRENNISTCYKINSDGKEKLLYGRFTGLRKLSYPEPIRIEQWPAYDKNGPIGLDPARYYSFFPGEPEDLPVTVNSLPENTELITYRNHEGFLFIGINQTASPDFSYKVNSSEVQVKQGELANHTYLVASPYVPQTLQPDHPVLPQTWSHIITRQGIAAKRSITYENTARTVEGERMDVIVLVPPDGGKGSEGLIEQMVQLPEQPDLKLVFSAGRNGGGGDGVHYIVRVNGQEIWRKFSPSERTWTKEIVDLTPFAGKTVLLSIGIDAGPDGFNRSNDQTYVGGIHVTSKTTSTSHTSEQQTKDGVTEKDDLTFQ